MKKDNRILLFLFLLLAQVAYSQQRLVSGTVSDQTGVLPGVHILVVGTKKGTQTDIDGKYSIKVKKGDVIVFSFLGKKTIEKTVGESNKIDVLMTGKHESLDEVVVVAYGKQSKRSIVGSVAQVGAEIIDKQQVVSVTSALQGSVAGVNIISSGGQPGNNPIIRIRGIGSINASASPLIVLDGVPFNGNLNSISADQVASLNVLKDASATALYGSRGANGVILIVTKKGKLNSPLKLNITSSVGFADQAVKPHKLMNTDDLFRYSWEASRNKYQYIDKLSASVAATKATDGLVGKFGYNPYGTGVAKPVDVNGQLVTSKKLWETDWRDLMFNTNALRTEQGLTGSGGSEKTNYFFSLNYLKQEGSITNSKFERVTSRITVNSKLKNWLNVGLSGMFSTSNQNNPVQSGDLYQSAIRWITHMSSVYPLYRRDENGQLILDGNGGKIYDYGNNTVQSINGKRPDLNNENAYGALFNYDRKRNRNYFSGNVFAQVNFTKDLNFKTTLGYEKIFYDAFVYANSELGYASNVKGRVSQSRNINTTLNVINALNYTKKFNRHTFGASIIHESYEAKYNRLQAQGTGFLPGVKVLDGSTKPEGVLGALNLDRLESYLGRLSYNYDKRYFIEGSYRRDGSTRFSKKVRFGNFYSVGGSWIVSNEIFLKANKVLNFLKLRASYGELGNNATLYSSPTTLVDRSNYNYFPYLNSFDTGWSNTSNIGVLLRANNDSLLTWEKTSSLNIGLEFGLFGDRIAGTVDYYVKKSIDLIYDRPVPGSTGNTTYTTNVGALKNYGVEITLKSKNFSNKNFEWRTNLNISFDRNKITELTQKSFIKGSKRWKVGTSLYEFFIRKYAGVDSQTGEALWYKDVPAVDANTGEPLLEANGEKQMAMIATNKYSDATRYQTGKQSLPDFQGGITNYFRLGNFDMNILFNFSFGSWVYDYTYAKLMEGFIDFGAAASPDLIRRWTKPGDITDVPRLLNSRNNYNDPSDRFLFKNDYVRLKALNIGYNLPVDMLGKLGIGSARIYFQGDNLLTFQSHKGIDPEQNIAGTTDNRSFNQRIFSLGVKLQF